MPLAEHDASERRAVISSISFNSRAPRGARHVRNYVKEYIEVVSIHVPLAEHDNSFIMRLQDITVSIHVPLAEHDIWSVMRVSSLVIVSIHVPLAEHDCTSLIRLEEITVSIHVPLAEHDGGAERAVGREEFQFTCPSRSTTGRRAPWISTLFVSIHVPLAEHDMTSTCGSTAHLRFQFTCPSRSTTLGRFQFPRLTFVSIHVPLAEHDFAICTQGL